MDATTHYLFLLAALSGLCAGSAWSWGHPVFASVFFVLAEKDAADRASIVAALERQLAKGDKALVGNTGFRRYLKTISEEHFAIDPDKIEAETPVRGWKLLAS